MYRELGSQSDRGGVLRHVADDRYQAMSAGIYPKGLNPLAVEAMREIGIDISSQQSKDVVSLLGQHIPYVVTVCDNAKERCPIFPGTWKFLHWVVLRTRQPSRPVRKKG